MTKYNTCYCVSKLRPPTLQHLTIIQKLKQSAHCGRNCTVKTVPSPNDGLFGLIIHERGISCCGKLYMKPAVVNYRANHVKVRAGTSPPGWLHLTRRMICVQTLRVKVESERC